ncbi:DEAD/DEAH box helicase [Algihabitans sp.]|uniref:DEAD/DEAH box helicase n=1 Tax=Algihabitans sp. TaxID=2821514 RepID=UPI003BAB15A5
MTAFDTLGLAEPLLRAVKQAGFTEATPIQAQAIPSALEGRDMLGIAQTGTGKTAAFALPILNRLLSQRGRPAPCTCRVLVLAPTRELAAQIEASFRTLSKFMRISTALVTGGAKHGPQIGALKRGVDVLVATPGRLIEHLDNRIIRLNETQVAVLDEADHMLDLGFLPPIRKLMGRLPEQHQTLLFSATMPKEISGLADDLLSDPVKVAVTPVATTAERVAQKVYLLDAGMRRDLLVDFLRQPEFSRTLVFTRTKRGADRLTKQLADRGVVGAAIHGDKSQSQRTRALEAFKKGKLPVLIATDVAARGIDVPEVSHVVNFELPNMPEAYVHRIGRTARAGKEGLAISFCTNEELGLLKDIQKVVGTLEQDDRRSPEGRRQAAAAQKQPPKRAKRNGGGNRNRNQGFGKPKQGGQRQNQGRPQRRQAA